MSLSEFYLVLVLGFVSSLHCVQMCGPIVLTYSVSLNTDASRKPMIGAHLAYNAGRIFTYTFLGAVAGTIGGAVGFVGRLAGIQNVAMIAAGIAMLLTGVAMLGFGLRPGFLNKFVLPKKIVRPVGALISSRSVQSKFGLGLLLGLLPCGLVYAALMKAVGTGSPLGGAVTLLAFGLGTSAAMVALGVGSSLITKKLARWGTTVAAVTIILLGAMVLIRSIRSPHGMASGETHHHHHAMQ